MNSRCFDENGIPTENGINDLRMGTTEKKLNCKTCNCNFRDCPGHFGFIRLAKPVFHVGFINECLKLLKCVCFYCSKVLVDDYDKYMEFRKINNPKLRQLKIYNYCKSKTKIKCRNREPKKKPFEKNEEFNEPAEFCKEGCEHYQPKYKRDADNSLKIIVDFETEANDDSTRELRPEEVLSIFKKISDEDCEFLGFDPKFSRPHWMIIQLLAVCPPQVRPSVSVDSALRSQDDLTHQYNEILKRNIELLKETKANGSNTTISSIFDVLQFNVATLMNNDLSSIRALKKSGQPIKAIYSRLKGKEGRVRGNLMGKRVDFSARSVISPDPNLDVDELGVPISIAMNLTFPETVSDLNIDKLRKLVNNGPNKWPGAKRIIQGDGKIIDLRYCKNTTDEHLDKGYIVERHMQNGDYVIFNRQPSLHKMSMMGHRVHILPYSTFRLNLSVTTPYNADFDGDEMNMHLPQSLETKSEIMNIMHVPKQIVSPQSNRPVMGIVQDTLIGVKLFTSRDTFLDYEQVMNLIFFINDFDIRNLPMPCIIKPKPLWTGKQIFSLIIPKKINLTRLREETPDGWQNKLNLLDNFVQISKGELIQGIICKKTVGATPGGIVHCIWMEENPQKTIEFLSNCQKVVNNWLLLSGWTVGISDIICESATSDKIAEVLSNMKKSIERLLNDATIGNLECQPGKNTVDSFEQQANAELNKARDEAGKLVQNALGPKNHLKNMVSAGSKGSETNISQIIAFVGQQNVEGKRMPFNFKRRTLPHFLQDDYKSESKGFVENSFLKGLTPQEFFFHAMGGREGIIDTAVKTSQTGYIQRRLIKALEDIMTKYDGTVRNSLGQLMQFLYGEDGMAGEFIENQKFETLKMDDKTLEYNFKFIDVENDENDQEIMTNFPMILSRFMEESVVNEIGNEDFSKLRFDLDAEFEQIKKDRDEVREKLLKDGYDDIQIPVNIKRIIINAESEFGITSFSKSDLNPIVVLRKVQELKKELILIKGEDPISIEGQDSALFLFNKVLNYILSTKNIIKNHRLNKKAFDFIYGEIKSKFYQAIVRPGEMVGSIAAQSIGEPATQMTLNTFHLAGVSSANVTLGVPRLTEVINLTKTLKTPSMTVFIKPECIGEGNKLQEQEDVLKFKTKIENTTLLSILNLSEIYYDPDIKNTLITEDKDMVNVYMEIRGEDIDLRKDFISPWLLRLEFDNKAMLNYKMNYIEEIIKKKRKNLLIIKTVDTSEKKIFHIRLECNPQDSDVTKGYVLSLNALKQFENVILTEISLGGIESIQKVYARKIKTVNYLNDGKLDRSKEEWVIETDGTNLRKIFENDEIDFKRTISNDLNEIYDVLGIEAVRKALVHEIRKILKPYGIYVNYRHISILCDLMAQKGFLTSITRHGLNKAEYGPIRKASFEETVEILLEAGIFSEKDELKGISENILLGNLTNVGTGNFDLLLDFNTLFSLEKFDENENNINNTDDELFINSPLNDNEYTTTISQTPYQGLTPNATGGVRMPNLSFSTYENNPANFTPGYNNSLIQSPYGGQIANSLYNGESSFISSPQANSVLQPSSPEYNPSSDYYKTPAPYSPIPDDNNRGASEYGNSTYSPIRSPGMIVGSGSYNGLRRAMPTSTPKSTYSPTTPGIRPSSNSPQYYQGSGIYSTTPKIEGSGSSQYTPATPNYYPVSPNYNLMNNGTVNNSSPFYNPTANDLQIKEQDNEDDEDDEQIKSFMSPKNDNDDDEQENK